LLEDDPKKKFRLPFLRAAAGVALTRLVAGGSSGQDAEDELAWPRKITGEKGEIVIYQPQVETFVGDKLESRAAISVKTAGKEGMVFGAMWFESRLVTDMETRLATLVSTKVTAAKFPDVEQEKVDELSRYLEKEMPEWDIVISIDRLLASLPDHQGQEENFGSEPPRIYHRAVPAVLVSIEGDPILTDLDGFELQYVANSAFYIFKDKKTGYYLRGSGMWFFADDISGPWKKTTDLPSDVAKVSQKIDEDEAAQAKEQEEDAAAMELEADPDEPDPEIIVSTVPAELIITDGEPDFATVEDTQLLYLKNTENDVLMDISSQQYFALFSGRWFKAPALSSDTWEFVPFEDLPADFAKIPSGSDMAAVLGSVPGTVESREAVLETSIPQTAEVDRKTATVEVTYDGDPQFETCGEGVAYALNTDKSVLLIDKKYYCVDSAIWFVGDGPTGPWQVATEVPAVVQDLPPDCPVYNVKYVYIYDSTPEVVYVGYTSGYYGSYVWGSCVVYGTGWYYHPWYSYYYYPRAVTYGYGVHYNPYTGWGYHYGYSYGWVTVGVVWYRPPYSCWGAAGYRYGYRRGYWHGYNHGYRHGYRHGAARGYRAGYRAGQRNSHHNAYRNRNNGVKHTGDVRRDSGGKRPSTTTGGKNNVYADRNGDVYRDKDGGWEKREDGKWSEDRSKDGDRSNQDKGTRDQGSADKGTRDQSTRDQGSADKGTRDQSSRDQGSADKGTRDQGSRDQSSNQQMDRDRSSRDRGSQRQQQSPSRGSGGGSRRSGGGGGRRR
jgi:hypothetical protein